MSKPSKHERILRDQLEKARHERNECSALLGRKQAIVDALQRVLDAAAKVSDGEG